MEYLNEVFLFTTFSIRGLVKNLDWMDVYYSYIPLFASGSGLIPEFSLNKSLPKIRHRRLSISVKNNLYWIDIFYESDAAYSGSSFRASILSMIDNPHKISLSDGL